MKQINNKKCYYDEDLKILKKSIESVRKLNWNKNNTANKKKDVKHEKAA